MIYPLIGLFLGALAGAFEAKRRGGKTLDLLQWGAVIAMIGGVIGMFIAIFITRAAVTG